MVVWMYFTVNNNRSSVVDEVTAPSRWTFRLNDSITWDLENKLFFHKMFSCFTVCSLLIRVWIEIHYNAGQHCFNWVWHSELSAAPVCTVNMDVQTSALLWYWRKLKDMKIVLQVEDRMISVFFTLRVLTSIITFYSHQKFRELQLFFMVTSPRSLCPFLFVQWVED